MEQVDPVLSGAPARSPPGAAPAADIPAPGAAVRLAGLEKRFDGVGAVRGISLDIRSGEFLTLLGPSGSGKTTTLMMIAGFETPDAGDIVVDGRSMLGVPPNRRNLGMVFQNYALFPHHERGRQHRLPACGSAAWTGRRGRARWARRWRWCVCRAMARAAPASSRAGSSSGWRWPGRSCSAPACC